MKWSTKWSWGKINVWTIPSLDLKTLDGRGKATSADIVCYICITSRFHWYNSRKGKFIFCLGAKMIPTIWLILFSDLPKVIVWVLLTIFYIIYIFLFQSSSSKPSNTWNCNGCRFSRKWQWETVKVVFTNLTIFIFLCS